ncbi:hypothetical protein ABZ705_30840 [Streptomyces sp. NPDC006984]|uniref:hypothetical protein n=1 Tax=Streptomyces sp. NPDC006984 TaxID=3155463 RepID=UPI003409BD38
MTSRPRFGRKELVILAVLAALVPVTYLLADSGGEQDELRESARSSEAAKARAAADRSLVGTQKAFLRGATRLKLYSTTTSDLCVKGNERGVKTEKSEYRMECRRVKHFYYGAHGTISEVLKSIDDGAAAIGSPNAGDKKTPGSLGYALMYYQSGGKGEGGSNLVYPELAAGGHKVEWDDNLQKILVEESPVPECHDSDLYCERAKIGPQGFLRSIRAAQDFVIKWSVSEVYYTLDWN